MGNSVPYEPRRGYARPGEIDLPIPKPKSAESRPDVVPAPNRLSSTPLPIPAKPSSAEPWPDVAPAPNRLSSTPAPIPKPKSAESRPDVAPAPNRLSSTPLPIPKPKSAEPWPDVTPAPNRLSSTPLPVPKPKLAEPWPDVPPAPIRLRPTPTGEIAPPIPKPKLAEAWPDVTPAPNRPSSAPPPVKDKINKINTVSAATAANRNKVSARFELLPDRKPQWNRIGLSAAAQLTALGLLLLAPLFFSQPMQTALKFDVVELMQPITQIEIPPETPPPPPKVKPKVRPPKPKPEVVPEPVVLSPKKPHVFLIIKPEPPKVRTLDAKPLEINSTFKETKITVEILQPAAPKEEVKVAAPSPASPAPVTVAAPLNNVQTGGFGNPNGLPGPENPNRAANINRAGSPLLPGGPGFGNGTGGARGIRGVAAADASNKNGLAAGGVNTHVDILDKPNPVYSTEARTLRIEGDVVLEVVFLASGQMQVSRVVSGLGHGLDEAAIQAAKQIRFRPAKRDGQPVDTPARVRIGFRLAG
jgi:TonB family protein